MAKTTDHFNRTNHTAAPARARRGSKCCRLRSQRTVNASAAASWKFFRDHPQPQQADSLRARGKNDSSTGARTTTLGLDDIEPIAIAAYVEDHERCHMF
jgi:hypothetical protein